MDIETGEITITLNRNVSNLLVKLEGFSPSRSREKIIADGLMLVLAKHHDMTALARIATSGEPKPAP